MKTIYSPDQLLHVAAGEFNRGTMGEPYERPVRVANVLEAVRAAGLGAIDDAELFPLDPLLAVHAPDYVAFLEGAYAEWTALGRDGDALPNLWPVRGLRTDRVPDSLDGRLAYYSFDVMTPVTAGSWRSAKRAADVALTGAGLIAAGREHAVFALCRPPGHHAARDYGGGYCFLNNAAIAAQYLRDRGAAKVAILDVDYHHGNGTQSLFYDRADILYASIHADPSTDFPYFLGYADETGAGAGMGCNGNWPLPRGRGWQAWNAAFEAACRMVADHRPDALVVSLGVDTGEGDPLSHFRLTADDFLRMGERLAALRLPTLIVFEGGYAIDEIGGHVVNVLAGFESRRA
jgi:acetoin utilization deacetylase AcuC-like enzyme